MTTLDEDKIAIMIERYMSKCPIKQNLSNEQRIIWIKGYCAGLMVESELDIMTGGRTFSPEDEASVYELAETMVDRVNSKQG